VIRNRRWRHADDDGDDLIGTEANGRKLGLRQGSVEVDLDLLGRGTVSAETRFAGADTPDRKELPEGEYRSSVAGLDMKYSAWTVGVEWREGLVKSKASGNRHTTAIHENVDVDVEVDGSFLGIGRELSCGDQLGRSFG